MLLSLEDAAQRMKILGFIVKTAKIIKLAHS